MNSLKFLVCSRRNNFRVHKNTNTSSLIFRDIETELRHILTGFLENYYNKSRLKRLDLIILKHTVLMEKKKKKTREIETLGCGIFWSNKNKTGFLPVQYGISHKELIQEFLIEFQTDRSSLNHFLDITKAEFFTWRYYASQHLHSLTRQKRKEARNQPKQKFVREKSKKQSEVYFVFRESES